MTNKKTRRLKYYPHYGENARKIHTQKSVITRTNRVGDDQIYMNQMKKNERKGKKKRSLSRTIKNKPRCINGGYVSKNTALIYKNPIYDDPDYKKYDTTKLHQYLIKGYNNVEMSFTEMIDALDEKLVMMKKGRTDKQTKAKPYYFRVET